MGNKKQDKPDSTQTEPVSKIPKGMLEVKPGKQYAAGNGLTFRGNTIKKTVGEKNEEKKTIVESITRYVPASKFFKDGVPPKDVQHCFVGFPNKEKPKPISA